MPICPKLPLCRCISVCSGRQVVKSTLSAVITDLKTNLLVLNEKLISVEEEGKHRDKAIHRLEKISVTQAQHS